MIRNVNLWLLIFLIGCGTSKQTTKTVILPDWVQKKPVSDQYYNGIGSSLKNVATPNFQQMAKNNALADLSSEITVTISSKSVLHQFESSLGYSEDFIATTKSESKEDLEGYELVQTFETETHYYVWYRLSKITYQQIKEQRRLASVNKALDYYTKALSTRLNNQYFESITLYLKGLEAIKPYLSESLEVPFHNQTIFLGNELFSGLLSVIGDIKIIPKYNEINVKNGEPINSDALEFRCINSKNIALAGIPVVFTLKQRPLQNNTTESASDGKIHFALGQIASSKETDYFTATVDFVNKASQITTDPTFRKLLRKIDAPKGQITLRISNPTFYVTTFEKNLDENLEPKIVDVKIKQWLAKNEIPVVFDKSKADFIIEIQTKTIKSKNEGKMFYCDLTGEVKVFNSKQELVFIKSLEGIKGVQLNYKDAGLDAYKNLTETFSKNLLNQLKEIIN